MKTQQMTQLGSRSLRHGLGALLAVGMACSAIGQTVQSIFEASAPGINGYGLGTGRTTQIAVMVQFSQSIVSVIGSPYLEIQVGPVSRNATFDLASGNAMFFSYDCQPGDFVRRMDCKDYASLVCPPGSSITFGAGTLSGSVATPVGATAGSLYNNANINVTTMGFVGTPATTVAAGNSVVWRVTRDASGTFLPPPATAMNNIAVTVTPTPGASLTVPTFVSIAANAMDVDVTLAGNVAGGPYWVRFTPPGYPATGAFSNQITVLAATLPTITNIAEYARVPAAGVDYSTVAPNSFRIAATFNQNIISYGESGGEARLRIGTAPSARYARCDGKQPGREDTLLFSYEVYPGDFAQDLDAASASAFELNGATLVLAESGAIGGATTIPNPLGTEAGALRVNSNIRIRTVRFVDPITTTVMETEIVSPPWVISRGLRSDNTPDPLGLNFAVTLSGGTSQIGYPTPFLIAGGLESSAFSITGLVAGTSQTVRFRPSGYPTTGEGDLVTNIVVTAGPQPFITLTPTVSSLNEADLVPSAMLITLSRQPLVNTVVNLTISDPTKLRFYGAAGTYSVTFIPGQPLSQTFNVEALDGTASVTVTATDPSAKFLPGTATVNVQNVAPLVLTATAVPTTATKGEPVSFYLDPALIADVAADRAAGFTANWYWGDGTSTLGLPVTPAAVMHAFTSVGSKTVTVNVRDKDLTPVGTWVFVIDVQNGFDVLVTITGRDQGRSYLGLTDGLGNGDVTAANSAPVFDTGLLADLTRTFTFQPAPSNSPPTTSQLTAIPTAVTIEAKIYDSFFHVWQGEGFIAANATEAIANSPKAILIDKALELGAVFSREYYVEDGWGDIDADELPDLWESQNGSDFHVANRGDNPDADFFPRGANNELAYPAGGRLYYPDGAAYTHVYEVRGFDAGLNAARAQTLAADFGPSGPVDEPKRGTYNAGGVFTQSDTRSIFGTDPNSNDTDGDGRFDGWEYYFWMNAVVNGITGEAYDPAQVITGVTIPSAIIAASFNPLVSRPLDADTDGDGLTDIEEMNLGTDPIHWDTDEDGMCDGWEVLRGLNPHGKDAGGNTDGDWMASGWDDLGILREHFQVYERFEFDPRTAWFQVYIEKDRGAGFGQPNTLKYTNLEEYELARFYIDIGWAFTVPATPAAWGAWTTDPLSPDTDGDQMPDGWELYVMAIPGYPAPGMRGFHPSDPDFPDADIDYDGDAIANIGEFHGQESCSRYATFANVNERWWNKFWPTDPYGADTDGDGLPDGWESSAFSYDNGYGTYIRGSRPGGMMNPCSVDTDMDYLPDYFEFQYSGINVGTGMILGMDGSFFDSKSGPDAITLEVRNFDYDFDGLENYQEYFINACYHFNYDKWTPGLGIGGYDPAGIFYGLPKAWDWATLANYWQGGEGPNVPFSFIPPEGRPMMLAYACGDPRKWDTDDDGMDDFYEMYHALNPLWSLTADEVSKFFPMPAHYDFRLVPWKVGDQMADPDQDGIPNFEEALIPNRPQPENHHTDPSPLWMTDMSYDQSWVNLYYGLGSVPMFWAAGAEDVFPVPILMIAAKPTYMFSFEANEGYDTDNDNFQDKQEIIGSTVAGVTDPLDSDSPKRRKALYLSGNAAARTRTGYAHGEDSLRSWTIEVWVKPVNPASGARQIIMERPVFVGESDTMPTPDFVRRTFRLGLEWNGAPFVEYDNAGKDTLTEKAVALDWPLPSTNWTHLAATMSGVDMRLTLYVNGQIVASRPTQSIPCTGFIDGTALVFSRAPLVVGASDANPVGDVNGGYWYKNGGIVGQPTQPALADFFTGWVDEVRVWDGARPQADIKADFDARKRYTQADVIASREATVRRLNDLLAARNYVLLPLGLSFESYSANATFGLLQTGGETVQSPLPPTILCHYTFDNLPDPEHEPIVPNSFDVLNGRPLDGSYPGIPWWSSASDRSTVYRTFDANPYLFVHWVENTLAHLPIGHLDANGFFTPDAALDSKYWMRFMTGDMVLSNSMENAFRNSANPYGFSYKHGITSADEVHPEFTYFTRFDPTLDTQYNNLLPLREAVADMDVPLWDNGTPGSAEFDSDGDGLPDWWEIEYGLDPNSTTGINSASADPDGDGLSNWAEYLAGTNPFARDSDGDGILDFDDKSNNAWEDQRTFGERFTDGDYVEDIWESLYDETYVSAYRYDEHMDLDNDGWVNWSERRSDIPTRPDRVVGPLQPNGRFYAEYPQPTLQVTFDYTGLRDLTVANPTLVVQAYTEPEMNGEPDAIFSVPVQTDTAVELTSLGRYDGHGFLNGTLPPGSITPTSVSFSFARALGVAPVEIAIDDGAGGIFWGNVNVGTIDYITGKYMLDLRQIPIGTVPVDGDYFYASYSYIVELLSWPLTLYLREADLNQGRLHEGRNYFHAFLDMDGSTDAGDRLTWTAGEPAGIADGLVPGTDVGWDKATVRIGLTDSARSSARFSWAAFVAPADDGPHTVTINRSGGSTVFSKTFLAPRTWLHEGDLVIGKTSSFGLDWGAISTNSIYEWRLDGVVRGVFTNAYSSPLKTPLIVYPSGAVVKSARPSFLWRMAPEATEFDIEIRRLSVTNTVVYSGRHLAPTRRSVAGSTATDSCVWDFPYSAGDTLPNGQVFYNQSYVWRIKAYSPRVTTGSAWSAERSFLLDVQSNAASSGGQGWFAVTVQSPSSAAFIPGGTNTIRVQAFTTRSFNDIPAAQATLNGLGTVTLAGLVPGTYYVRAFVDQNNNREHDLWETYGYLRSEDDPDAPFGVLGVVAEITPNRSPVIVIMRNTDVDQDRIPDALEYRLHGAGGGDWLAVAGPGPIVSSPGYSDYDGDGLNDLSELVAGSDITLADTDSDGIDDLMERSLNFLPRVPETLLIASSQFDAGALALQWRWTRPATAQTLALGVDGNEVVGLGQPVSYVVQRATSLSVPDWGEVQRKPSQLSADSLVVPTDPDASQEFYRILMLLQD